MPLSVSTHAANHHEVRLVQLCFDFYMIEAKPENLIGDRAYDSDPLDEELRNDGIEMIAPHRSNRSKPPTQDRRRLSRYMRRWLVERFFAWIQWQRRILVRWERLGRRRAVGHGGVHSQLNHLHGELWQCIRFAIGKAVFDGSKPIRNRSTHGNKQQKRSAANVRCRITAPAGARWPFVEPFVDRA